MNEFGALLRNHRIKCNDPKTGRVLSQQRFGELLREKFGVGFSGAAISDWERGKSKIHADDRPLLTCLIQILYECGGIQSPAQANELLETGNYRNLNLLEIQQIFKEDPISLQNPDPQLEIGAKRPESRLWEIIFFEFNDGWGNLIAGAREGPPPLWTRVVVALMRSFTARFSASAFLQTLFFIWIWIAAYFLIAPSFDWSFMNPQYWRRSVILYVAGTLVLPPLIGLLANTKNNKFWKANWLSNSPSLRLYTHQGAFVGFHIGYFAILFAELIRYSLHLPSSSLLVWAGTLAMLVVGYIGATVIPYNIWRAYSRLNLRDGVIFFAFILMGPFWGLYLLQYFPMLTSPAGLFSVIAIVTLLSGWIAWQTNRRSPR
ncbi:MAG: hypothetical protein HFACDABA_00090 [Anaerolineales bacterium]|nr:hypothetical protein [Anaerolineales bacterium]